MDQSMWQTFSTFDPLHSSHLWIRAILLCGTHSTTMQIRIVPRLWFCKRPWRLKINIRWTSVHFRKPHVLKSFLSMKVYAMMGFPLSIFWIWWLKYFIPHRTKPTKPKMWESHGETCRQTLNQTCENQFQPRTPISIWSTLITFHQTEHILVPMQSCTSVGTMRR